MGTLSQQILHDVESLPPHLQEEARIFVRNLKMKQDSQAQEISEQKQQFSIVIERIAQRGTAFSGVEDPVEWQTETRKDRPLSGRE